MTDPQPVGDAPKVGWVIHHLKPMLAWCIFNGTCWSYQAVDSTGLPYWTGHGGIVGDRTWPPDWVYASEEEARTVAITNIKRELDRLPQAYQRQLDDGLVALRETLAELGAD